MNSEISKKWFFGLGPVILLGLFVLLFVSLGPMGVLKQKDLPPIEEVSIQNIRLAPNQITLDVINDGPDPVTISQVLMNDAFWQFDVQPSSVIPRLGKAKVAIPYPWNTGDVVHLALVSESGATFDAEIPVAVESPKPTPKYLLTFASLGIYVGVVPVFLGLLWLPFLRRLSVNGYRFFLALTIGLLVFLGVDALFESLEMIEKTAKIQQGLGVALIGLLGIGLGLSWVSQWTQSRTTQDQSLLTLAYLIAFGIGVHNLGEGLAIGGAYSAGELGLGTMLVIGFMLHNITEGVAIIAPIAKKGAGLKQLLAFGALAGLPTILGTWVGGFAFSPIWSVFFLAVGAGAVFQVVFQIVEQMKKQTASLVTTPYVIGFITGIVLMVVTSRFVVG